LPYLEQDAILSSVKARKSQLADTEEATGSNPIPPTI